MPLTSQIREPIPPTGSSRRKPKGHILGLDFCLQPYPIEPGMTYSRGHALPVSNLYELVLSSCYHLSTVLQGFPRHSAQAITAGDQLVF